MLSEGDWRTRLEFLITVFLKMEVMLKLLILLFFLVVAAVVLIEWKLTITQSIGELHLLKVLLPFKAEI